MKSIRETTELRKRFQPVLSRKRKIITEPKIVSCRVNKEKLTVKLEDNREISILINDLNKK
jgi:hypothetical protein